jgi:surfeit locus 1 family protein
MNRAPLSRRIPIGLTIAAAISLVILCALGTWQLQRLAWKRDLLARVAALQAAPAQPAGAVLDRRAAGQDVDFTRVALDCPGLASAPYLELYSVRHGQAGVRLISACPAPGQGYRTILVDRGFIADTISARSPDKPSMFAVANDARRNHWYTRDIAAMARALGAPSPAPVMLMAETASNPHWKALVPAPLPTEIPNRHLEYALTWFGLAGALIGVYAAVLWRRWKA